MLALFFIVAIAAQCAHKPQDVPYYGYEGVRPEEFRTETDRLQGLLQNARDAAEAAGAHIQLAFLYSHYRNPSPDYHRSLAHLEAYASLNPEGAQRTSFQNWLRMLQEIVKSGRANEELKAKMEQMKKDLSRLDKENTEIKEKLEQLKNLDIELEEKRRSVK
ncbi:MAG: hypothetical protein HZA16_11730 [Nitrospirae bacterium]|nr:hypothetical protein [Nitrospirota bacterium]